MVYFYRLFFCFFSLLFSFNNHAAVPILNYYYSLTQPFNGIVYQGDTPSGVCSLASTSVGNHEFSSSLLGDERCSVTSSTWNLPGPALTYEANIVRRASKPPRCPTNSTAVDGLCLCDAGFEEDTTGTACIPESPSDPCELLSDMCSGSQGKTSAFSLSGKKTGVSFTCMSPLSFGGDPLPGCTKGCMAQVGGFTTSFQSDDGNWVTQGTAKYSGSTCDPSVINDLNSEADPEYEPEENPETSNTPDPSCPNGFKGTVNGVSVCVPPKGSSGITELEEKDNGDGTKTNTKTEVKCENGKCEVTKTSTTTNTTTNSTVSSSSVTTTVDKADYCSKNSSAGVCKNEQGEEEGKGSFGGSCQAGFTCKGDAAMCAMAKEQHKRNCETLEEDKDPSSFFNQVKNGTDSQSAKAMQDNASEINISTQLNKNGYGWSRSCPANTRIDLSFVSGSFEMPFDKLCGPLKIFSDIALAITALSLLVWLVFAGREKAGT